MNLERIMFCLAIGLAAAVLAPLAQAKKAPSDAAKAGTVVIKPAPPAPQPPLPPQEAQAVAQAAARIDTAVLNGLAKANLQLNPPASDEKLVRRLYLDIAGRIPTADETSAFLADNSSDKRARLIDRLLASDGYNSSMFNWLADMLRVSDDYGKGSKTYVYEEWLKEQIAANRPWDGFVHDLLTAEGRLSNSGPVGFLLRDRGMPLDSLSNTLTIFLGANIACAQCHDHPVAKWKQREFYEMASFFGATDVEYKRKAKGVKLGQVLAATGAGKNLVKGIVAVNAARIETLHRDELTFPKDYKYSDAKPGEAVKPKLMTWVADDAKNPAYSIDTSHPELLRERFANWITHPENPRFATAIANRLWKRFFGIAVQEPVGDLDEFSKASNRELLEQLTVEMKRVKFDLKEFQRIVLNSQTYQRQVSGAPDPAKGPYLFPGPVLRRMSAAQAWDSVLTLVVGPELDQYKLHRAEEVRRMDIPGKMTAENLIAKNKELTEAEANKRKRLKKAGKGSGVEVSTDEFDGAPPRKFEDLTLARASELAQPAKEAHFLRMFGQSDRQLPDDSLTEGGVPQVLMLMNGHVQKCITSPASVVLKHAAAQSTPQRKVQSLYRSFLGRDPREREMATAIKALEGGMTVADLTWALFNSREFIFVQ
jgi:hypothetical protein